MSSAAGVAPSWPTITPDGPDTTAAETASSPHSNVHLIAAQQHLAALRRLDPIAAADIHLPWTARSQALATAVPMVQGGCWYRFDLRWVSENVEFCFRVAAVAALPLAIVIILDQRPGMLSVPLSVISATQVLSTSVTIARPTLGDSVGTFIAILRALCLSMVPAALLMGTSAYTQPVAWVICFFVVLFVVGLFSDGVARKYALSYFITAMASNYGTAAIGRDTGKYVPTFLREICLGAAFGVASCFLPFPRLAITRAESHLATSNRALRVALAAGIHAFWAESNYHRRSALGRLRSARQHAELALQLAKEDLGPAWYEAPWQGRYRRLSCLHASLSVIVEHVIIVEEIVLTMSKDSAALTAGPISTLFRERLGPVLSGLSTCLEAGIAGIGLAEAGRGTRMAAVSESSDSIQAAQVLAEGVGAAEAAWEYASAEMINARFRVYYATGGGDLLAHRGRGGDSHRPLAESSSPSSPITSARAAAAGLTGLRHRRQVRGSSAAAQADAAYEQPVDDGSGDGPPPDAFDGPEVSAVSFAVGDGGRGPTDPAGSQQRFVSPSDRFVVHMHALFFELRLIVHVLTSHREKHYAASLSPSLVVTLTMYLKASSIDLLTGFRRDVIGITSFNTEQIRRCREAAKTAFAILLAILIFWSIDGTVKATPAAIIAVTSANDSGEVLNASILRLLGSLVGGVVGLFAVSLVGASSSTAAASSSVTSAAVTSPAAAIAAEGGRLAALVCCAFIMTFFRASTTYGPAALYATLSAIAILAPGIRDTGVDRLQQTCLGVLVYFVVVNIVYPVRPTRLLRLERQKSFIALQKAAALILGVTHVPLRLEQQLLTTSLSPLTVNETTIRTGRHARRVAINDDQSNVLNPADAADSSSVQRLHDMSRPWVGAPPPHELETRGSSGTDGRHHDGELHFLTTTAHELKSDYEQTMSRLAEAKKHLDAFRASMAVEARLVEFVAKQPVMQRMPLPVDLHRRVLHASRIILRTVDMMRLATSNMTEALEEHRRHRIAGKAQTAAVAHSINHDDPAAERAPMAMAVQTSSPPPSIAASPLGAIEGASPQVVVWGAAGNQPATTDPAAASSREPVASFVVGTGGRPPQEGSEGEEILSFPDVLDANRLAAATLAARHRYAELIDAVLGHLIAFFEAQEWASLESLTTVSMMLGNATTDFLVDRNTEIQCIFQDWKARVLTRERRRHALDAASGGVPSRAHAATTTSTVDEEEEEEARFTDANSRVITNSEAEASAAHAAAIAGFASRIRELVITVETLFVHQTIEV